MKAFLQGFSDDLIHVDYEGGYGYEFNCAPDNDQEWVVITFEDGTRVQVEYNGCWKFSQLDIGESLFVLDFEATDMDDVEYSDRVTLHEAYTVSRVTHFSAIGRVKESLNEEELDDFAFGDWPVE